MTIFRGFLIVAISSLACAGAGALLGYLIGVNAPGYYQVVFRLDEGHSGRLPQLGLVLGGTQGLGAGLVVGCVIMICVTWYSINKLNLPSSSHHSE